MSFERRLSAESSSSSSSAALREARPQSNTKPSATDIAEVYPQDSILPKTVILRLIREAVKFSPQPAGLARSAAAERYEVMRLQNAISVSDEALFAIQKHAHDFISFITHEANEICSKDKRKTITGDDIIAAFDLMGFENYSRLLQVYYVKWKYYRQLRGPSAAMDADQEG